MSYKSGANFAPAIFAKHEAAKGIGKRGQGAPLPVDGQVVIAHDALGAVGFVYRRSFATHMDRPEHYYQRHVQCVAIHAPPGEHVRVSASRAVADLRRRSIRCMRSG